MTRTMVDGVLISNWPAHGWDLAAAYINGTATAQNYATARLAYPAAQLLKITVNGQTDVDADICDCETGDYDPQTAALWAKTRLRVGVRPTVYSSRATWPAVVEQLALFAIQTADVDWWASTLDGTLGPELACGDGSTHLAAAVQYTQPAGAYDLSVVYDDGWHPSPKTRSPRPVYVAHSATREVQVFDTGRAIHLPAAGDGSALTSAPLGLPYVGPFSEGYIDQLLAPPPSQTTP